MSARPRVLPRSAGALPSAAAAAAAATTAATAVPVYQLYGEGQPWLTPDPVHVESIAARSRQHQWEIRPHRHHGLFQLLWLQQGSAHVQLDGSHQRLDAGSVLLLPQHCVHGFRFSRNAQGVVVTLAYAFLAQLHGGLGDRLSAMVAPQRLSLDEVVDRAVVEALLPVLLEEYGGQREHRALLLESLLVSLLCWLTRTPAVPSGPAARDRGRQYLAAFSAAIERDHARHLPLEHYAAQLGISTAHLNAVCRELAGCSALALVHARLMLEARRQLVYTSMSVRDIGDALGFADPAYFTRFFKRGCGLSPRQFRERAQRVGQSET